MKWRRKKKKEEGRTCGAASGYWSENGLDGGQPFFFFSAFFSGQFFLSFPVLFLLPLSGRSFISVVATVVEHGAGGDGGGRMWLHMVVPCGGFSSFLLCFYFSSICLCFYFFFCFSRCRGCYQWRGGRWQLVVALGWRWWRLCGQQPVVLPPFSPSLFSLPRLGNGVGGVAAVLLVCAEAHASSSS